MSNFDLRQTSCPMHNGKCIPVWTDLKRVTWSKILRITCSDRHIPWVKQEKKYRSLADSLKSGSFFTIFLKFSILREWVKLKEKEVFALLNETPPNGQKYTKFIKHLIERENFWVKWKNEGEDYIFKVLRKSEIHFFHSGCQKFMKEKEPEFDAGPAAKKRRHDFKNFIHFSYKSQIKVGCIFPMAIWPKFRKGQYRDGDHREYAAYFMMIKPIKDVIWWYYG